MSFSNRFVNLVVGAGKVGIIRKGQYGKLTAPNLTKCTATLLRGTKGSDSLLMMTHRQPMDFEFANSIKQVVDAHQGYKWEVIAVQTAPETDLEDYDADSVDGTAKDLSEFCKIEPSEIFSKREPGVQQSYMVNQMIVDVDESGKETVQRRKGGFWGCIVM